jgi:hypothetical protein
MSHNGQPDATGQSSSMENYREMEQNLNVLRSVVCELLQDNQQLREALLAAKTNPPQGRETL